MASLGLHITLILPQLDTLNQTVHDGLQALGDRMADALDPIRASIDHARTTLETELTQIADAIRAAAQDPEAVQAVAADVDDLAARIANIIPDAPPAPTPPPTA